MTSDIEEVLVSIGEDRDTTVFSQHIDRLLAYLEPAQQYVISERFGLDGGGRKTLEAIGRKSGRERERIRQIQNTALRRLRRWIERPYMLRGLKTFTPWNLLPLKEIFPKTKANLRPKKRKARNHSYVYQDVPQWMLPDRPVQERSCTFLNVKDGVLRIPYPNVVKFLGRGRHLAEQIIKAIDRAGFVRISPGVYVKILKNGTERTIRTCDDTSNGAKFFIVVSERGYAIRHSDPYNFGNPYNLYA